MSLQTLTHLSNLTQIHLTSLLLTARSLALQANRPPVNPTEQNPEGDVVIQPRDVRMAMSLMGEVGFVNSIVSDGGFEEGGEGDLQSLESLLSSATSKITQSSKQNSSSIPIEPSLTLTWLAVNGESLKCVETSNGDSSFLQAPVTPSTSTSKGDNKAIASILPPVLRTLPLHFPTSTSQSQSSSPPSISHLLTLLKIIPSVITSNSSAADVSVVHTLLHLVLPHLSSVWTQERSTVYCNAVKVLNCVLSSCRAGAGGSGGSSIVGDKRKHNQPSDVNDTTTSSLTMLMQSLPQILHILIPTLLSTILQPNPQQQSNGEDIEDSGQREQSLSALNTILRVTSRDHPTLKARCLKVYVQALTPTPTPTATAAKTKKKKQSSVTILWALKGITTMSGDDLEIGVVLFKSFVLEGFERLWGSGFESREVMKEGEAENESKREKDARIEIVAILTTQLNNWISVTTSSSESANSKDDLKALYEIIGKINNGVNVGNVLGFNANEFI